MTQNHNPSSGTPNGAHRVTSGEHARNARRTGNTSRANGVSASRSQAPASFGTAGTADGQAARAKIEPLSHDAMTFLEARGLDAELAVRHEFGTVNGRNGGEWLAIPYRQNGVAVNHKYRRLSDKRFQQDKGGKQVLWNVDVLDDDTLADQPVIITEGELDALAAIQSGFPRTVSVPGGAPSQETDGPAKYQPVVDVLDKLKHCRRIILASDGDGPGRAMLHDLSIKLGRGRCQYLRYPEGTKDLNDVLLGWGAGAVAKLLNNARWCHVPGVSTFKDLPPLATPDAYITGIPGMQDHYRIRRGDFSVFTGIPGSGKTTFWNDVSARMAEKHGWRTCFASFEQPPQTEHFRNFARWFNRKPVTQQSDGEVDAAREWVNEYFHFVTPPDDEVCDLDWLLESMATAVIRFGDSMVIIDPWNELDHKRSRDQSLTEYTGDAIRTLKRFARKYDVHLVVCAHPTKMAGGVEGRVPKPTLYNISDSAHWYNKADVGCVIHPERSEDGNWYTEVGVQKTKYHDQIGFPGLMQLVLNTFTGRYEAA